jgi:hypothetical protein
MSNKRKSLEERLSSHPELKEMVLGLLEIAESDIERADEVEEQVIEGVRGLGKQVIEEWALQQEQAHAQALTDDAETSRHGKKNSIG